jgi:hypothetical protein
MPRKPRDLTGQSFGRLVAIEPTKERVHNGNVVWRCVCSCGEVAFVRSTNLTRGVTQSCGCLRREKWKFATVASLATIRKHGHRGRGRPLDPTYSTWQSMKMRCMSPNATGYPWYGAKGIRVCDRWLLFENFLADMGERPSREYSIDRIDSAGHYEPGNCRWLLKSENTRRMALERSR